VYAFFFPKVNTSTKNLHSALAPFHSILQNQTYTPEYPAQKAKGTRISHPFSATITNQNKL
jgi:hypothetical protein